METENRTFAIKRDSLIFVIITIVVLAIFGNFLSMHYAVDTYNIMNIGYEKYAIQASLNDGRIFMCGITMLAGLFNVNIQVFVIALLLGAILISNIAVIVLKNILCKYKGNVKEKEQIMATILSFCTIYNFMYIENLYFAECFVMAISILFYLIAADVIVEKKKYSLIKSMLLVILGVFLYQGTIGTFLMFSVLFSVLKKENKIKDIIQSTIKTGLVIGVSILVNIITVKIVGYFSHMRQNRMGSISNIFTNLTLILKTIRGILIDNVGLFPRYAQITFVAITIILTIVYLLITKKNWKRIGWGLPYVMIMTIASGSITYLMSMTSFYTGRLRFGIGALVGVILIFLFIATDIFDQKNFKLVMTIMVSFYTIINVYNYIVIIQESKLVNQREQGQVMEIENYIRAYETESNRKVNEIAIDIVRGQTDRVYDEATRRKNVLTYNAVKCCWGADGAINFYSGRKLIKVDKILDGFNEINQDYICVGNCLYIKTYMY